MFISVWVVFALGEVVGLYTVSSSVMHVVSLLALGELCVYTGAFAFSYILEIFKRDQI